MSLLRYLVCPKCKQSFELEVLKEEREEVLEGSLSCPPCCLTFPIRGGIPRIVSTPQQREAQETIAAFGWQWQKFDEALRDSRFDSRELFLDFIAPIGETFFKDKIVMDAGCGTGRFTNMASEFGAEQVIGVDLSSAVEVAYRNSRKHINVHIVQADIQNLPFSTGFDYIFSVGVLHHLPQPRDGFHRLLNHLKEDGSISIWVYGREQNDWLVSIVDPVRRHITSRMPSIVLNALSGILAILIYPVLKLVYKPINQWVAFQGLREFLVYNDYLMYLAKFKYSSIHAVIFDHLSPRISHYITREDLVEWFSGGGCSEVRISSRTGNSWRGFGSKSS